MIEVQTHLSLNRIDADKFRVEDGLLMVYKAAQPVATFREWISAIAKPDAPALEPGKVIYVDRVA